MKVHSSLCTTAFILVTRVSSLHSFQLPHATLKSSPMRHEAAVCISTSRCTNKYGLRSLTLSSTPNRCDQYAEVLSKPRWGGRILGPIVRYLNTLMIGFIFSVILRVFNKFTSVRRELLVDKIFNREDGRGMLTVSNHQSMADDPGLFAALIPWWRISSKQMRWVLCTEDIFFFVSCKAFFSAI
jgi:hypothetical protein